MDRVVSLGVVAPSGGNTNLPQGTLTNVYLDPQQAQVVQQLHGKLSEVNRLGKLFYGSNGETPSVTTVALATTYTGLALYNPAGSGKVLYVERVGYSFLVAFPAAATIGLMVGWSAAGIATASAAASPGAPCLIGANNGAGVGCCALSATLVGTPTLHSVFGAGLTGAITTVPQKMTYVDMDGSLILQPGAYAAIYTSTVSGAASLCGSFLWSEEPLI